MGVTAYPLSFCSVIFLAILLERTLFYIQFSSKNNEVLRALKSKLKEHSGKPKVIRDELVSVLVSEQQVALYSGHKWLRLIGLLTPLLGLFGTIIGLIAAFVKIADSTGAVNPSLVADGLYLAMLTTAYGLAIALPALFFASIFKFIADSFLEDILKDLNRYSLEIEGVKI